VILFQKRPRKPLAEQFVWSKPLVNRASIAAGCIVWQQAVSLETTQLIEDQPEAFKLLKGRSRGLGRTRIRYTIQESFESHPDF
jgi:hypothetical protein